MSRTVRTIREARGYSQGELARRAGLAKATVNDLESNAARSPGLDTLTRIADALDVHVATLLGVESSERGGSAVEEIDRAGATDALADLGLQLAPEGEPAQRFFRIGRGFSLCETSFAAGDVLTVAATGEPALPSPVVVANAGRDAGFEVRFYLDPYLIGPSRNGSFQHEMKQSPDLTIIGEISARSGKPN